MRETSIVNLVRKTRYSSTVNRQSWEERGLIEAFLRLTNDD